MGDLSNMRVNNVNRDTGAVEDSFEPELEPEPTPGPDPDPRPPAGGGGGGCSFVAGRTGASVVVLLLPLLILLRR